MWQPEASFNYPYHANNPAPNNSFGVSLQYNIDGSILLVGAPYAERYINGQKVNTDKIGGVYIYERDLPGNLNLISDIYSSVPTDMGEFGMSIGLNAAGNMAAIASPKSTLNPSLFTNPLTAPNVEIFT